MFFRSKEQDQDAAVAEAAPTGVGGAVEQLVEEIAPPSKPARKGKKKSGKDDDDLEYEWEFSTPFGKIEFELDPKDAHEEKERKRREKAERNAARKAEKLARLAAKEAEKRGIAGPVVIVKRNNLLPALVIFTLVAGALIVAFWLFARPDEESEVDAVPPELRNANALAEEQEQSSGVMGRIKKAVRAGKQASREAQREQEQKFHEMSKQS